MRNPPPLPPIPYTVAQIQHPPNSRTKMTILQADIPDDLSRQVRALAQTRSVPFDRLVEEALRSLVAPEPFHDEASALKAVESHEAEALRDGPWQP